MKYYRLKKDLPTFKVGELFFINNYGQLVSNENKSIVAYSAAQLRISESFCRHNSYLRNGIIL